MGNSEAHKSIKRYQGQLREVEGLHGEESRQRADLAEKAGLADRCAGALQGELEEARALLDSADRGKKQADMELCEARGSVNDMTTINSKASSDKRRLESAVHTMHAEIDDMLAQAKGSEEKSKRAMVDAARLADELRAEQDHSNGQDKAKRALESQVNELEMRLAEANELATMVAVLLWLSLRIASVSLRLNLDLSNLRLLIPTRASRRLSAASRNFNSNKMKTTRTKIACLIWLASCKLRSRLTRSKLKKLRRLLLSTWPSSARPNKTLRKLKRDPRWLVPPLQFCKSTLPQSISHEELQLGDLDV